MIKPVKKTMREKVDGHIIALIETARLAYMGLFEFRDVMFKHMIEAALRKNNGLIAHAARDLKMDRGTLTRWVDVMGCQPVRVREREQ